MDKRKLIGTIIGVIMFAALIIGATYAWLTFNARVTNTVANGTTLSYWVDYEKGEAINELPILTEATTQTAASATIKAQRPEGSIANNIKIFLTTTSNNTLTNSGTVKYVICEDECDTNFSGNTINSITATSTIEIFSGLLNDENDTPPYPEHTYKVYFWLDASIVENEHIGQTFSAYIHAESTQDETIYG